MTKHYYIEARMGSKWVLIRTETRQTDALHYVKMNGGEKYPLRIVKVTRTVVFQGA